MSGGVGGGLGGGSAGGSSGTILVVAGSVSTLFAATFHPSTGWTTTTLAGTSTDAPAVAMANGSGLVVFRSTSNNDLRWSAWSGSWTALAGVGAGVTSRAAPSLVATGSGYHLVFHGEDFKHYSSPFLTTWGTVEQIGGSAAQSFGPSPGSVTALGSDVVFAFAGNNQDLYDQRRTAGVWQAANGHGLGSVVSLTPRIAPLTSTRDLLVVFVRTSDQRIIFTTRAAGSWSAPAPIDTNALTNEPISVAGVSGGALVAYRGQNGQAYWSRYTDGVGWSAPLGVSSPNLVVSSPPVVTPGIGGVDAELLALTSTGAVVHLRLSGATWSAPVTVGGTALTAIGAASSP